MIKARCKLSYSVSVTVMAKDVDQLQDFLDSTTPDEARKMCDTAVEEWTEEWDYVDNNATWDIKLEGAEE